MLFAVELRCSGVYLLSQGQGFMNPSKILIRQRKIVLRAKYGSEHRMSLADAPGRKNSRRKYANETRRYGHLRGEDLEAIRRDIDPRLLDAFRYAFSDARRREVVGGDAACSTTSSRWRGH